MEVLWLHWRSRVTLCLLFQNLSNDHHDTSSTEPSATLLFTEESYHRLRCWSVSGMLLSAAPTSMKNAERRRDALKPGRHETGEKRVIWWQILRGSTTHIVKFSTNQSNQTMAKTEDYVFLCLYVLINKLLKWLPHYQKCCWCIYCWLPNHFSTIFKAPTLSSQFISYT